MYCIPNASFLSRKKMEQKDLGRSYSSFISPPEYGTHL